MTPEELALRMMISGLMRGGRSRPDITEEEARRALIVEGIAAGYVATPSLVVIAVRGTPPRGTLLVNVAHKEAVFYGQGRARVVAGDQSRFAQHRQRWGVVAAFLEQRRETLR